MESRIWELLQAKGDFTLITLRLNAYPCYMSMHLRMENFFRAGDWLELIRDEGDTNAYHHLPVDLFMMGMVAYFELGNHSIISSLCRTISRIINKTERAVQAEKVFMRYIQKPPAPLEEEQYWVDFKKALSPLKDQPHEKVKFEYFDFIAWIDSKIEKRPLGELLKERQQPIP